MNAGEQHKPVLNAADVIAALPPLAFANPVDPAVVCLQLAELQTRRKLVIKAINRLVNAATSRIARALNFNPNANEKARKAIWARAQRMALRAFADKPQAPADNSDFLPIKFDIDAFAEASAPLVALRMQIEKRMMVVGRFLPVRPWAQAVAGLGEIGVAVVIGETGDPAGYPNFRHVWKRLGLMPVDGHACSVWRRGGGLSADDWQRAGYAPRRRAEIHACVAEPMLKHQIEAAKKSDTEFGRPKGRYGEIYVKRREKTKRDHSDWTKAHAHADAMRIMSKALIADLWAEWGAANA